MSTTTYAWRCPSNIALVKYWGKWGNQYPHNPSVSFTLSEAHTETSLSALPLLSAYTDNHPTARVRLTFTFEGQPNPTFAHKVQSFLDQLCDGFPFLLHYAWHIETRNSFPHSSGIASSASAMGALSLCICSAARNIASMLGDDVEFWRTASQIARLGSGSACRSIYPQAAIWGVCNLPHSSNDYAIPFAQQLHPTLHNYCDTILIVSRAEKQVSSRAGHALMQGNPYAPIRYQQATQHLNDMLVALQTADLDRIIAITESEALALHALMMTSTPSYMLMRPNTLHVIEKIRQYRTDTNLPICFTLDAGPNVHVLYPNQIAHQVTDFIQTELLPYCEEDYHISDHAGKGAILLND